MKDNEEIFVMIKRFKNHCEIHGWPSKSFKIKVKQFLKNKENEKLDKK